MWPGRALRGRARRGRAWPGEARGVVVNDARVAMSKLVQESVITLGTRLALSVAARVDPVSVRTTELGFHPRLPGRLETPSDEVYVALSSLEGSGTLSDLAECVHRAHTLGLRS